MSTVPELITETQALLKKAAKATANAEDVLRWFNDLNRRLQPKARIKRSWEVTVTSGTEEYHLPVADYPVHSLTGASYLPTGHEKGCDIDINPVDALWQKGIRFQEALPGVTAHTLWVWPADYAGAIILHGYLELLPMTNTEACYPIIREDFHDLYPLYAAARFGGQDEDFGGDGRFSNYMSEFLRREQEFTAEMSKGAHAGARRVRREW